jgi:hypothetical protein
MSTYQTSKDYALLWELAMSGAEIICFIDDICDDDDDTEVRREIAKARKKFDDGIQIGTRTQWYISTENKENFIKKCEKYHVEFLPPSSWIPVSEKLPRHMQSVLICSEDGRIATSCFVRHEGYPEFAGIEYDVYAWMPMPEPYEVGNDRS